MKVQRCQYKLANGKKCNSPTYCWKTKSSVKNKEKIKQGMYVCINHVRAWRLFQNLKERQVDQDYSQGERSPYWEYRQDSDDSTGDFKENNQANPDYLAEESNLWNRSNLSLDAQVLIENTFEKANKLLTPKQKEIFDMLVFECRNQLEIANILRISRQAVAKQINSIRRRLH